MANSRVKCIEQAHGDRWSLYRGDCCEIAPQLPAASIDFAVYSPPFSSLYIYSESERDHGNTAGDDEFLAHYWFLAKELYRLMRPGRDVAVHCKDLVSYAGSDVEGEAGVRDFSGDLIRVHEAAGFKFHCRITIHTCPVNEMMKTKNNGLLFKTTRRDASHSRAGLPEYLLIFRKWPKTEADHALVKPVVHDETTLPLALWQSWAQSVWFDHEYVHRAFMSKEGFTRDLAKEVLGEHRLARVGIRRMEVLNEKIARANGDEKHLCPLQLDVIERAVKLWSNAGDTVFSPYAGIGSEGYVALDARRRFIGVELKDTYFKHGVRNLSDQERDVLSPNLLDLMAAGGRVAA